MLHYITHVNGHGLYCFAVFTSMALLEIAYSVASNMFIQRKEVPSIQCINNKKNTSIIKRIPSAKEFNIAWFARGPRAQTLLQACARANKSIVYEREIVKLGDGVDISFDWKQSDDTMCDTTPIIFCLHGLGGNSNSRYLQTFTNMAYNKGYRSVVYNRRGHGGGSLLSTMENKKEDVLFPKHSNIEDMESAVAHLCHKYPLAPKYLIGFSCGANLGIKYIATSEKNPFIATASISNGYNIHEGSKILSETSPVCDGIATQFLKDILVDGRLAEVQALSKHLDIDFGAVMNSKSLRKLEELLIVPLYGYKSLQAYYEHDSCHNYIQHVNTPLLCIANMTDPLIPCSMVDVPVSAAKTNKHVISIVTNQGGHIGWVENDVLNPWYAKVFFEYIQTTL